MTLSDFSRYPLTFGPSPLHPLTRLTAHLGGAAIWAKRENCNSGLAYGGNKTRKAAPWIGFSSLPLTGQGPATLGP